MRRPPSTGAVPVWVLVVVLALAVVATTVVAGPRPVAAYPGAPAFEPNADDYDANFPDPSVFHDPVSGTYVAMATPTGGWMMPTMRSTDLRRWDPREAYDPMPPEANGDPWFSDGLVRRPAWAPREAGNGHPWSFIGLNAPGVDRIGGRYVAWYSANTVSTQPGRWCLGVAVADAALGPYRDVSGTSPVFCDDDPVGSRDPDPFVDPMTGTPYLVWKSEGVPGSEPTRLWARELRPDGLAFAAGSEPRALLATGLGWHGQVIENPSMVRHGGRYLLFYSANEWVDGRYATGYAVCDSPLGPCRFGSTAPLLATGTLPGLAGPGGGDAFVAGDGRLLLAVHAWREPHVGYPDYPACGAAGQGACLDGQRHLHVIELAHAGGQVSVVGDVEAPPATSCASPPTVVSDGGFTAVVPSRVLDTRTGVGVRGVVGPRRTIDVPVAGCGGVPDSGVDSVVLNVTSTESTAPSFVTVWPTGRLRPNASALNTEPGQDTPNLVVVKVGDEGRVSLFNNAGSTHLVADVVGWFPTGSGFVGLTPTRLLDTRAAVAPAGRRDTVTVDVAGRAGVGADAEAVVVNVTSTGSTVPSFVTVWPSGVDRPNASALNTEPGQDTPNLVVSAIGDDGRVALYNHSGSTHLVADVVGWFEPGSGFVGATPRRLLDTRAGSALGPRGSVTVPVGVDAEAVVVNVTSTGSSAPSFVTVWPSGVSRPNASALNTEPGQDTPNLVVVKVGDDGRVSLYNHAGSTDLVVDLVGWFETG